MNVISFSSVSSVTAVADDDASRELLFSAIRQIATCATRRCAFPQRDHFKNMYFAHAD